MNRKRKFTLNGYITVVSIFIFSILLSLVMVLITGVQKSTLQVEAELALDTACNSALAEYHQELLSQYDLFFIDTAYGTATADMECLEEHIRYYAEQNLKDTKFWDIYPTNVEIVYAELAADQSGQVLEKQILEYMENTIGINALSALSNDYKYVIERNENADSLLQSRDENQKRLDNEPTPVKITHKEEYDAETGKTKRVEIREEVPIVNPAESVNKNRNKGILNLVTEHPDKISNTAVDLNHVFSKRGTSIEGSGFLSEKAFSQENEITEKLLLNLYMQEKCGCYVQQKEASMMAYQQEYILCGESSDIENLKGTVYRLVALREAMNASYLYSDVGKRAEISAMAASVAAVAVAPHIQPLLETSILFAWAYIESLQDVRILLEGGKIPLIKTDATWNTSLSSILNFDNTDVGKSVSSGLGYEDYLNMFFFLEKRELLLSRLMDVMEMDIRKRPLNEKFKIDGCVSAYRISAYFQGSHGHSCDISKVYAY